MKKRKAKLEIVVSNLIERDGKFLLVQEKEDPQIKEDPHKDKWNLPGGSLEHGEGLLDCAIREGKEETELILEPTHLIRMDVVNFSDSRLDLLSIVVRSEIIRGGPIATKDVKDVRWFSLDEIRELNKKGFLKASHVINSIEAYVIGRIIPLSSIDIGYYA